MEKEKLKLPKSCEMDREDIGHPGPVVYGPGFLDILLCFYCLALFAPPPRRPRRAQGI